MAHQPAGQLVAVEVRLPPEILRGALQVGEVVEVLLDEVVDLFRRRGQAGAGLALLIVGDAGGQRLGGLALGPKGPVERQHRAPRGGAGSGSSRISVEVIP